ncbi:MAG TPA: acyl-CoA dehydrogenase family protein [Gemmataceae bacterium]|nr:acyl-CoA dehydrogenase family protein [Gemmataceae bacterium]
MALTAEQLEQQKKQAEELLFSGPQTLGFAKGLFYGHFNADLVFPYPEIEPDERKAVENAVAELRRFADEKLDPMAIDRNAEIPPEVISGLGTLGVLGMTAPKEYGGRGLSQLGNCKILEEIGSRCSATAIFVNAHQSIGIRALLLFGTEEQKRRWLPALCTGEKLAAFALTEPQAGSDAGNVQTTAIPSADGKTYMLNGEKRYITNGGIAQVLTVMARTPPAQGADAPRSDNKEDWKVTAFLVTPDMPGFEVVEARMPKCGIRGTATARLAFHDMPVPAENVLGQVGKGLKVALTVLDFGRTTFGASCTGAAKTCLRAAARHAKTRVQFKQTLSEFELVKKKIAFMAASAFAMEATTSQCAGFIDRGAEDYMLETAMLKVWSTEALWIIVNDMIQIFGGQAYFSNEPYERMMRDARINQIGEGANDVLRAFIALVGMRGVGEQLKGMLDHPLKEPGAVWRFVRGQLGGRLHLTAPEIPVRSSALHADARRLGQRVRDFGLAVVDMLRKYREAILERQYVQERIADAACDLYASSCTLSRLDSLLAGGNHQPLENHPDVIAGQYFLKLADRRIRHNLAALHDNDDADTTRTANAVLKQF